METHLSPTVARWTLLSGAVLFYGWSYVGVPCLGISEFWTSSQTGWRIMSVRPYLAGLVMLIIGRICCDALPDVPWWWVIILVFFVGGGLGHVLWPQFPESYSGSPESGSGGVHSTPARCGEGNAGVGSFHERCDPSPISTNGEG